MRVVKRGDLKVFPLFGDISGRIIFFSDRMMFLLVEIPPRGIVPEHSHPHEQMGICLKGRAEFISKGEKTRVDEGTFYWIEPEERHSIISIVDEPSLFLDVFSPPRDDYIKKTKDHGKTPIRRE